MVSRPTLSFDNSSMVLKFCSLNIVATKLAYLELHKVVLRGFKNFINSRFPRVTKSLVNKSLSKLVKKCSRMGLLKLARVEKNPWHVNIIQW